MRLALGRLLRFLIQLSPKRSVSGLLRRILAAASLKDVSLRFRSFSDLPDYGDLRQGKSGLYGPVPGQIRTMWACARANPDYGGLCKGKKGRGKENRLTWNFSNSMIYLQKRQNDFSPGRLTRRVSAVRAGSFRYGSVQGHGRFRESSTVPRTK